MSKASVAAKSIKKVANQLQGFIQAAEVLEEIGSLDNAANEARARMETDRKAMKSMADDLAKKRAATDKAIKALKDKLDKAESRADEIIDEAKEEAEKISKNAKTTAAKVIYNAEATAADTLDSIKGEIKKLEKRKSDLAKAISESEQKRDALVAEADDAQKKLDKIKEQLAKLSGGLE